MLNSHTAVLVDSLFYFKLMYQLTISLTATQILNKIKCNAAVMPLFHLESPV